MRTTFNGHSEFKVHSEKFLSDSFQIEWNMIVVIVFLLITNLTEFSLAYKQKGKLSLRSYSFNMKEKTARNSCECARKYGVCRTMGRLRLEKEGLQTYSCPRDWCVSAITCTQLRTPPETTRTITTLSYHMRPLIGSPLCREMLVSQTADVSFFVSFLGPK